jgi:23S rRNA pseudouridine1911/1915/1917 synthase
MPTLYEDSQILAVSKPAGMVVHPTYKNKTGTLVDALTSPEVPRPSIVGRLDKWTSGIVLVAKNPSAHAVLQRSMSSPDTAKIYLAVVSGHVDEPGGTIDLPLKIDPRDRRRVIVAADGSPSVTSFERLGTCGVDAGTISLLRCRPMTGRRHQIRVHLAARGWPVLGDAVYGDGQHHGALAGHALHSWKLTFRHPVSNETIRVKASPPDPLARLLAAFDFRALNP